MADPAALVLDELLPPLVADLRDALGADLVGLYLTGSAATGDFDPAISDIDLVAVITPPVGQLDMERLGDVHRHFVELHSGWLNRLEVVYVSRSTLAQGGRGDFDVAVVSPGEDFHKTRPASEWLQNWYLLRQHGIPLVGPPPTEVVGEISVDEFVAAARWYLSYTAAKPLTEHSNGALAYSVLSACRALYTIATGRQLSKTKAAEWIASRSPEWAHVALTAIAVRTGAAAGTAGWRTAAIDFVRSSAASASQQQRDARTDQRVRAERDR